MHIFGLTGGMGSGKSTVAAYWRRRGLPILDADEFAREVVAPGTDGLREIVSAFGSGVLDPSGALDRKAMAQVAFSNADAVKRLNAITHPRITDLMIARAADLARGGEPLACFEAALLVENQAADQFRPLVVVACSPEVQLERIRARDPAGLTDALDRLRNQKPLMEKVAAADYVIDTSYSLERTVARADEVLRAICGSLGIHASRYSSVSS